MKDQETSNEVLLIKQGQSLKRIIKHSSKKVSDIAKAIDVDRQTVYLWMRGKAAIPEQKLNLLAKMFHKNPAEIRYDISLFNPEDLVTVVKMVEIELINRGIERIDPEKKATLICMLYDMMQEYRRSLHDGFVDRSFKDSAVKHIEYWVK